MSMDQGDGISSTKKSFTLSNLNAWKTIKVLFLFVSQCCEGEVAVTSTLSMVLSPTGAWRRPPALPVLTSVFSAGGMNF